MSPCCPQPVHDAMTASLDTFLRDTFHVGVQRFPDGQTRQTPLLMGNCPACATTLCMEITEARGHVVTGEVVTRPPADGDDDLISTTGGR